MKELRDRVLIPLAIPLGAMVIIVIVVMNFSRILLAVEERGGEIVATSVAVVVASTVLLAAAWISSKGDQQSRGNVGALVVSGLLLVTGGAVGAEAIQEEHDKHAAEEGENELGQPNVTVTAGPGFKFTPPEATAPPGEIIIEYVNADTQAHTFVIEGVAGFKLEVGSKGDKAKDKAEIEPGQHVYFCDIPGHRQGGMEGTLTVAEGAPGGGGPAPGGGGEGATFGAKRELKFDPAELTVPGGPVPITLRNDDQQAHNLVVEGQPKFQKLEVVAKDETATGTLDVGPGTYILFCDIAGHRAAGMEATLIVGG
ncbi:MAG: cupredoxin domain-containing protein [Acidimicrobiia bacterium]